MRNVVLSIVPKMFNDITAKNKGLAVLQSLQFIILGGDSMTSDIFKKCLNKSIKNVSNWNSDSEFQKKKITFFYTTRI